MESLCTIVFLEQDPKQVWFQSFCIPTTSSQKVSAVSMLTESTAKQKAIWGGRGGIEMGSMIYLQFVLMVGVCVRQLAELLGEPEAVVEVLWWHKIFCHLHATVQVAHLEHNVPQLITENLPKPIFPVVSTFLYQCAVI